MTNPDPGICLACNASNAEDAKFCEACGHDLATVPPPSCVSCGGEVSMEDGYCNSCGTKQPAERDHQVCSEGQAIAGSDRGRRHHHNEDAFAIATLGSRGCALVVCDGVSSTPGSADASLRAAAAACEVLVRLLANEASPDEELRSQALSMAAEAAQREAADTQGTPAQTSSFYGGPPSSTFVAGVAFATGSTTELSVAWIGDSRAYWIGVEPELLTVDHEIEGSLSRWLGADSPGDAPDIAHHSANAPGRVLLCSDGLWRYAASAEEMSDLVDDLTGSGHEGTALVEALLGAANDRGGHDNISVALWPEPQAPTEPVSTTESTTKQQEPEGY